MAKREKSNDSNAEIPNVVPVWAERLRERARAIGMTDIAVARRVGLSQSRYASYVGGKREPDFQTFLRICRALDTRPDIILGIESSSSAITAKQAIRIRIISTLEALDPSGQRLALASLEGMAEACLPDVGVILEPRDTPKPSRR